MLSENERVVAAKLKASGFEIFDRLHQDDWVALAARFAAVKVD
jgi:ribosomal protein L11 methylase PrmA